MKRKIVLSITALALAVTVLLALTSCGAILGGFGASTNDITRKLKYELNDTGDGYIVVGSEDYAPKVVIPDTYEGKPVVGIDSGAFSKSTDVHRVVIGDNVTTIGDWAFYECNNLTSITIGESVTEIDGDGIDRIPFFGCVKLVEVINKSALDITAGEKDYGFVGYYAKEVHNEESKVIDSRPTDEGQRIRRRRECLSCGKRFTTYEIIESLPIIVIKKDKSRETFNRDKLMTGLLRACEKRPVSIDMLDNMIDEIETVLQNSLDREISSEKIGELVMEKLKAIDEVAYVRFASVYRQFKDINTFMQELNKLLENN
jgi:transcriptional repressor NrdR